MERGRTSILELDNLLAGFAKFAISAVYTGGWTSTWIRNHVVLSCWPRRQAVELPTPHNRIHFIDGDPHNHVHR